MPKLYKVHISQRTDMRRHSWLLSVKCFQIRFTLKGEHFYFLFCVWRLVHVVPYWSKKNEVSSGSCFYNMKQKIPPTLLGGNHLMGVKHCETTSWSSEANSPQVNRRSFLAFAFVRVPVNTEDFYWRCKRVTTLDILVRFLGQSIDMDGWSSLVFFDSLE